LQGDRDSGREEERGRDRNGERQRERGKGRETKGERDEKLKSTVIIV